MDPAPKGSTCLLDMPTSIRTNYLSMWGMFVFLVRDYGGKKISAFLFKLFKNKENTFSYENQIKINFENKENKFTIFNILYMNQKTVMYYFYCFRIKSKTRDLIDWNKTKIWDYNYFLLFFSFHLSLRFSSYQTHENTGL